MITTIEMTIVAIIVTTTEIEKNIETAIVKTIVTIIVMTTGTH